MRSKMEKWADEKFYGQPKEMRDKIARKLENGTTFWCREPKCSHKWKSKPGEVFEKCPKCGSHRITFKLEPYVWPALFLEEDEV